MATGQGVGLRTRMQRMARREGLHAAALAGAWDALTGLKAQHPALAGVTLAEGLRLR